MLLNLLIEIVQAEYAQWMRYTYLYSLGFGLHTDSLSKHFQEHASDELSHAEIISRWIVDLGGIPPTNLTPVEQFCGSVEEAIDWLINAEIEGIEKYNRAHHLSDDAHIHGLTNDIDDILSQEQEHLSDLRKYINPILSGNDNEDDVVVVIADKKQAQTPPIDPISDVDTFLSEGLENAAYKYGPDYTPQLGYESLLEDIEKSVEIVWNYYQSGNPDVKDQISIYTNIYNWLKNPSVLNGWNFIHDKIWPDYSQWLESDKPTENMGGLSFSQILEQIEPREDGIEEDEEQEETYSEETLKETPAPSSEFRRPVDSILVKYPKDRKQMVTVGPGKRIYNSDRGETGDIVDITDSYVTVKDSKTDELLRWSLSDSLWESSK